jgi:hypothetical protein
VATRLTDREVKVLRYMCSTTELPVAARRTMNYIAWSDLPHTLIAAFHTLESLTDKGLVKRVGIEYEPTDKGRALYKSDVREWN